MSNNVNTLILQLKGIAEKQHRRVLESKCPETLEELIDDVKELEGVIVKIVKLQKENPYANEELLSPQTHESSDTLMNNFLAFMEKEAPRSGINDTVGFKNFNEGNGVVALRDISANEVLLEIPRKVMISLDTATRSSIGELAKYSPPLQHLRSLLLVMHLLYERLDPSSYWKPYLDILPSYVNLPIFATLDDLMTLRGSACFHKALKQYQSTVQQYVAMWDLVHHKALASGARLQPFSYDAFRWASATVMARQNPIPCEAHATMPGAGSMSAVMTLALIPGFDMLNHRHLDGAITTHFDVGLEASVTEAPIAVAKGEQVYVYYGERPNSHLFLFQGFVASDNAFDYMAVSLPPLLPSDPIAKVKQMLLKKLALTHCDCRIPLARELSPDVQGLPAPHVPLRTWRDVWRAVWVRCMDKHELSAALTLTTKTFDHWGASVAAARASGEALFQDDCAGDVRARVLEALITHLQAVKQGYAATEAATAAVSGEGLSERAQEFRLMAARLREVEVGLIEQELQLLQKM